MGELEVILDEARAATPAAANAYLCGAAHDACFNQMHKTTRFAQRDVRWLEVLHTLLDRLGHRSWTYREGQRSVHILETCWTAGSQELRSPREKAAYIRGYFDAEGGVPRDPKARFYIQFVQKDRRDLDEARQLCLSLGLACGRLHNPSANVDPHYWRFYVVSRSYSCFGEIVGSWHPGKRGILDSRRLVRPQPLRIGPSGSGAGQGE